MSMYVKNNLQNNETVVLKAKISPLAAARRFIWALIFVGLGIYAFVGGGQFVAKIEEDAAKSSSTELASLGVTTAESAAAATTANALNTVFTVLGIAAIVIGLVPFILKVIDLLLTEIAITDKRVIGKRGIVKMVSLDIHIDKIDTINISTTFLGRIFRFYDLSIKGSGAGEAIQFYGVVNANQFKNAVNAAIEAHAESARKAQAAEIAAAMGKPRY